jgi:outer membrane protein TolC
VAVDGALRDAEDALSRYRNGRSSVATLARAKAAADEATELTKQKHAAGTASTIDLLDAQRQQITAEQGLSQAEAELTTDYISLQKALGLGWASKG